MFVLNGILALSILLLLVFILAMMTRVNLLSRQIDTIHEILNDAEKKVEEINQRFKAENGSEK